MSHPKNKAERRKINLKKDKKVEINTTEIVVNKKLLIDVLAAWLYATRMVDDAEHIKDITWVEGITDNVTLLIQKEEGKK
jgi:hypothetical protein